MCGLFFDHGGHMYLSWNFQFGPHFADSTKTPLTKHGLQSPKYWGGYLPLAVCPSWFWIFESMHVRFVPVCEPFERHPGLASPRRVLRHGFKLRQRKAEGSTKMDARQFFRVSKS